MDESVLKDTGAEFSAEDLSLAFERDSRRYNRAFFEEDE